MVSRGGVAPFDGDLDDYQRYLLDEAKRQREEIKQGSNAGAAKSGGKGGGKGGRPDGKRPPKAAMAPNGFKPLKTELDKVEAKMAVLNGEGAALESHLGSVVRPSEIAELGKRLKSVNDELKRLEDQWLELSSKIETVGA